MRALLTGLATALALASPAAAAVSCRGEAKGVRNDAVRVTIERDDGGRVVDEDVTWNPPSGEAGPFPMLFMSYRLEDDRAGALTSIGVGAVAPTQGGPPRSRTAVVQLRTAGRQWTRPWSLFESNMAALRAGGGRPDASPVSFFGVVPMAWVGPSDKPALNPDLLEFVPSGGRVEISIDGDRGENFGRRAYDISDVASRDALLARAIVAARDPSNCKTAA